MESTWIDDVATAGVSAQFPQEQDVSFGLGIQNYAGIDSWNRPGVSAQLHEEHHVPVAVAVGNVERIDSWNRAETSSSSAPPLEHQLKTNANDAWPSQISGTERRPDEHTQTPAKEIDQDVFDCFFCNVRLGSLTRLECHLAAARPAVFMRHLKPQNGTSIERTVNQMIKDKLTELPKRLMGEHSIYQCRECGIEYWELERAKIHVLTLHLHGSSHPFMKGY